MPAPRKPRAPGVPPSKRSSLAKRPHAATIDKSAVVSFGPEICNDLAGAEQREWLVTNGIGGFASGTIAGSATRRYHGLLIAALKPPAGRTLLVGGLDETVNVDGNCYALATHRWVSGAIAPQGHLAIQSFRLDGLIPVWTYSIGSALIAKRFWMSYGENTAFAQYTLLESASPVDLELKVLVNYRDFHSATHAGDWRMRVEPAENGVCVAAFEGAVPFYVRCGQATCEPQHIWYRNFYFSIEHERGLDDREDQLYAALFRAKLEKGQDLTIVLSTERGVSLDGAAALKKENKRERDVLAAASTLLRGSAVESSPSWLQQLVLAADQFLVKRSVPGQPDGKTVIAGYHWFGDWGRDTMIVLPGFTLATGRPEIARQVLLAFSQLVDAGMLPNNFPDSGEAPGYNTIDATLWYFEAIRQYFAATEDLGTLQKLFPALASIIDAQVKGTRYNIHVDPEDGLLYGGGPGVQLTWMDAKIADWVVTPRTGKPVEINALWINALESMAQFAKTFGASGEFYERLSTKAKSSFRKFWNEGRNCCFDVLDSPRIGSDAALRPNQIFFEQQKAVVDICTSRLLTPFGLRSLAPDEPGYSGIYTGGPRERDAAYHQGPVWGWLLGPYALAHYRVYKDRAAAIAILEPLAKAIDSYGVGTLAEIFEGDPPYRPRGCIAQAWSVAEILRAWKELHAPLA